ncbi:MAG: hypothetical protein JOY84_14020 [Curvibacter sp.]|nr:hypothetical protein [Curvibacter sp.]
MDPRAHRLGLTYLVSQQQTLTEIEERIETVLQQQKALQKERLSLQQKLDGLERHRDQELAAFLQEAARREAAEADREWIARERYRPSEPKAKIDVHHEGMA